MLRFDRNHGTRDLISLLAGALAVVLVSACSGSLGGPVAVKTTLGLRGHFAEKVNALRTCLKKNGATLPRSESGSSPNVRVRSGDKLQSARKKCGESPLPLGANETTSATTTVSHPNVAKFTACMRANGVRLGTTGTSEAGGPLSARGINSRSATFKVAEAKCIHELTPAQSQKP